jgi:hypothetical protein
MTTILEPAPFAIELTRTRTGLEQLEALRDQRIGMAPMLALMNMRLLEVSKGRVIFSAVPEQRHYNPQGTGHGGLTATVLDSAMGCTVLTVLGANKGPCDSGIQNKPRPPDLCPDRSTGCRSLGGARRQARVDGGKSAPHL